MADMQPLGLEGTHRCAAPGCDWHIEFARTVCRDHDPVRRAPGIEYRTAADGETEYRGSSGDAWTR